jgi:transposase, IS6 family
MRVKGRWCYLYRAIDSSGATIDFLFSALRDAEAAKRLFRRALSHPSRRQPRVINTDLAPVYNSAIVDLKKEGRNSPPPLSAPTGASFNNIMEQDHRAIKRRVKAKQGFRAFHAACHIIRGYEAMHMIRKGQVRWLRGSNVRRREYSHNAQIKCQHPHADTDTAPARTSRGGMIVDVLQLWRGRLEG